MVGGSRIGFGSARPLARRNALAWRNHQLARKAALGMPSIHAAGVDPVVRFTRVGERFPSATDLPFIPG